MLLNSVFQTSYANCPTNVSHWNIIALQKSARPALVILLDTPCVQKAEVIIASDRTFCVWDVESRSHFVTQVFNVLSWWIENKCFGCLDVDILNWVFSIWRLGALLVIRKSAYSTKQCFPVVTALECSLGVLKCSLYLCSQHLILCFQSFLCKYSIHT